MMMGNCRSKGFKIGVFKITSLLPTCLTEPYGSPGLYKRASLTSASAGDAKCCFHGAKIWPAVISRCTQSSKVLFPKSEFHLSGRMCARLCRSSAGWRKRGRKTRRSSPAGRAWSWSAVRGLPPLSSKCRIEALASSSWCPRSSRWTRSDLPSAAKKGS